MFTQYLTAKNVFQPRKGLQVYVRARILIRNRSLLNEKNKRVKRNTQIIS